MINTRVFIGGEPRVQVTWPRTRERYNTGYVCAKTCANVSYKRTKVDHTFAALQVLHKSRAP